MALSLEPSACATIAAVSFLFLPLWVRWKAAAGLLAGLQDVTPAIGDPGGGQTHFRGQMFSSREARPYVWKLFLPFPGRRRRPFYTPQL